ncbi:MAG: cytidine deaminase [Bacteroidia bacterium]|nr:cytidine deaminase [Bacteroidia bacterium]
MTYSLILSYDKLTLSELEEGEQMLVQSAKEAASGAYAPYSKFGVGAAIRLRDGRLFTGNNQENAAYPSGLCAERTLLFYLGAQKLVPHIQALAVFAPRSEGPVMPCGACRQVMYEYESLAQRPWILIFAGGETDLVYRFVGVDNLLPFAFLWRPS